eukprot:jgi/Tetstr1/429473/TSEL_019381.t1
MAACAVGRLRTIACAGTGEEQVGQEHRREEAAALYKALAEHCFTETKRCAGVEVTLFNSDPSEKAACEAWLAGLYLDIPVHTQVPDPDLGERMAGAFQHMFDEGAAKAVIIGTDIPDVSADIVTAAFAALDSHQMVLGPAC